MALPPEESRAAVAWVRDQAVANANADLARSRAESLAYGQQAARQVVRPPAAVRGRPAAARYQHSRRVLREWFIRVYETTVAAAFGAEVTEIGAADIEAIARLVRSSVRADLDSRAPFRAVVVLRREAELRALQVVASVYDQLVASADRAAVAVTPQQDEQAATQILRHWYRRCYLDRIDQQMALQPSDRQVTDAEAVQVVACVASGRIVRVVGEDGVPLVTAHGTALTIRDRELAAGKVGVQPANPHVLWVEPRPDSRPLRSRLAESWRRTPVEERRRWAGRMNAGLVDPSADWGQLDGAVQEAWTVHWLHTNAGQPVPFTGDLVPGSPELAAAAMFNHGTALLDPVDPVERRAVQGAFSGGAERSSLTKGPPAGEIPRRTQERGSEERD